MDWPQNLYGCSTPSQQLICKIIQRSDGYLGNYDFINTTVLLYQNMQCDVTCSSNVYMSLEKVFHTKNGNFYVFLHLMIYFSY